MHPAFATMQFGPFLTDLITVVRLISSFGDALSQYLEEHLLPQVDEPIDSTSGSTQGSSSTRNGSAVRTAS